MSRGGGGPGQAHRRHHQVIVMVRVAYRLFPWCSIALCNCIDHHIVTGTEKRSKKDLQKKSPGQACSPPCLPCFSAATQTWCLPPRTSGRNLPLRLLPAHCPTTDYCIVLGCVSRQWVAQLYSSTAMCLPGHFGGWQDLRSRSPGHEKCWHSAY